MKDRVFKVKIRNDFSDESDLTLTLSVSFPSTYPKTIPQLNLNFGKGISPSVREEAEWVVKIKPSQLVGTEMIFEIATALQEILGKASETATAEAHTNNDDTPNLLQERAIQEATENQKSKEAEEEKNQTQKETDDERQQRLLSRIIEQERAKMGNRKNKQLAAPDPLDMKENVPGGLQFDQPVAAETAEGTITTFHVVNDKVDYRKGPVTNVFTVQPLGSRAGSAPFLALKECKLAGHQDEKSLNGSVHDLESHLDMLKHLTPHPNILRPLSFNIQRSLRGGWDISILTPLAAKGSVKDILDAVGTFNVETIRTWAIQLLEGLDFYHRNGIIHASVHVGNILLEEAETGNTIVKLSDGVYQHDLHRMMDHTHDNHLMEAAIYWTAPEVVSNSKARPVMVTDIWDLGVVILQMIFGLKITRHRLSPTAYLASRDVSRSIEDLLHQMVHTDMKKRKSAFDLKMFEFFRTEETVLREPFSPITETLGASFTTSIGANPRRDSIHRFRNHSRYLNDFDEIGRLGRGGYGEVVKARHKLENQAYAIKKIRQTSMSALNKVLSEIVMLSQLNHPNVVRYFTAWTENEGPRRPESLLSSSSSSSISLTDGDREGLFTKSSGGLDFIGAEPPNVIFGFDDDEEGPELKATEDAGNTEESETESGEESDYWSKGDSEEESDQAADDQLAIPKRRHSSSHEISTETTLYIQMQYCERQVSFLLVQYKSSMSVNVFRRYVISSAMASIQNQRSVGDCFAKYSKA
jgi:eukaryotic translation initiation factor 2-alpha kinase 4